MLVRAKVMLINTMLILSMTVNGDENEKNSTVDGGSFGCECHFHCVRLASLTAKAALFLWPTRHRNRELQPLDDLTPIGRFMQGSIRFDSIYIHIAALRCARLRVPCRLKKGLDGAAAGLLYCNYSTSASQAPASERVSQQKVKWRNSTQKDTHALSLSSLFSLSLSYHITSHHTTLPLCISSLPSLSSLRTSVRTIALHPTRILRRRIRQLPLY